MAIFLMILMFLVAIFLVLVVLVQRGRGGGLAGAFGSGGGSNSAFGTKTGDVFTTVTVILFGVFLLLAITLGFMFRGMDRIANPEKPAVTTTMAGEDGGVPVAPASQPVEKPGTTSAPATKATAPATTVIAPATTTSQPATTSSAPATSRP